MNQNARKSFREVAQGVGPPAPAVINKGKRLEGAGAIKGYIPIVDPSYFGIDLVAIIALRISKGKLLETQQKISSDRRVAAVYDITGEWDSLVIGCFQSRDDLNDFIKGVLALPYIDRTGPPLVLNAYKEEKRVLV